MRKEQLQLSVFLYVFFCIKYVSFVTPYPDAILKTLVVFMNMTT